MSRFSRFPKAAAKAALSLCRAIGSHPLASHIPPERLNLACKSVRPDGTLPPARDLADQYRGTRNRAEAEALLRSKPQASPLNPYRVEPGNSTAQRLSAGSLDKLAPIPSPSLVAERVAAARTLQRLGYSWHGGVEWKPPLGHPPPYISADPWENKEAVWADAQARKIVLSLGYKYVREGDYGRWATPAPNTDEGAAIREMQTDKRRAALTRYDLDRADRACEALVSLGWRFMAGAWIEPAPEDQAEPVPVELLEDMRRRTAAALILQNRGFEWHDGKWRKPPEGAEWCSFEHLDRTGNAARELVALGWRYEYADEARTVGKWVKPPSADPDPDPCAGMDDPTPEQIRLRDEARATGYGVNLRP